MGPRLGGAEIALLTCGAMLRRAAVVWLLGAGAAHADGLAVDPHEPHLARRPDLVARIADTPHAYFRFVNAGFAAETCRLLGQVAPHFPEVNLHGDAHVEQYAVTSLGRGLTDFDDCTRGQPVIDLVRFGSSLVIAAREKGWAAHEGKAVDDFLRGYRDGLTGSHLRLDMPTVATRLRARFKWDHAATIASANRMIDDTPLPNDTFADGVARLEDLIAFARELSPRFFVVKRIGALSLGIGSALDEKYLILVEGMTDAPEDDLILEAKQIRDLAGNPCVRTDVGAARVLDGQRLIAYEPFAYAAVVPHGEKYFWVHDWTDDYAEASIKTAIGSLEDLREIAYDAGVQLGRAHPKRKDASTDRDRAKAVRRALSVHERRIRQAIEEMADRTETAWREFRQAVTRPADR
jgi:uncharacterized protein (DUF2252 family)